MSIYGLRAMLKPLAGRNPYIFGYCLPFSSLALTFVCEPLAVVTPSEKALFFLWYRLWLM